MELSLHAQTRCQQRTISPVLIEWLLDYGTEVRAHGATKRFFDKEARRRLSKAVGADVVDRLGDLLDHYLIETGSIVVTAGVRRKRIRRV